MFTQWFANTLYIQIRKNAFSIRHIEGKSERQVPAQTPFTSQRLLIGEFQEAAKLLKKALSEMNGGGLFRSSPTVVIHPIEMVDGGLCEVEERIYKELAMGAGARKVFVHVGSPLADTDVRRVASQRP